MATCRKPDGTLVTCTAGCRVPWGCPAEECYDPARAEYVVRSREAIQAKLQAMRAGETGARVVTCKTCTPATCLLVPECFNEAD